MSINIMGKSSISVFSSVCDISKYQYEAVLQSEDGRHHAFIGYLVTSTDGESDFVEAKHIGQNRKHNAGCVPIFVSNGEVLFDNRYERDTRFRIVENCKLYFPWGARRTFGVTSDNGEELEKSITSEIFGADADQVRDLFKVINLLQPDIGRYYRPTITSSTTADGTCDISGARIPKKFPYVNMWGSGINYEFSRVSLSAFYGLFDDFFDNRNTEHRKLLINSKNLKSLKDFKLPRSSAHDDFIILPSRQIDTKAFA